MQDDKGVQFVRRMTVLQGLRLCNRPNVKLVLVPLYSFERQTQIEACTAARRGRGCPLLGGAPSWA